MSVPYGAPQQQPRGPAQPAVGLTLGSLLPFVAAGLGLIAYLLAFTDDVNSGGTIQFLLAAAALAGLTAVPKSPKLLPAAAVLAAVATLLFLQGIIKSTADVQGMDIVLLIVAVLETAAIVLSLLLDAGIVKFEPKPANPFGQPGGWSPQSSGFPPQASGQFGQPQQPQQHPQHPQHPQQPQQPQQQPQQFGQPQQPQQTSFLPQPGQFGQPQAPGTPPGGFGGPPQA